MHMLITLSIEWKIISKKTHFLPNENETEFFYSPPLCRIFHPGRHGQFVKFAPGSVFAVLCPAA
jgi:hypothetical protein